MTHRAEVAERLLRKRDLQHIKNSTSGSTIDAMQEVLSRPCESDKPLSGQEYWTLELFDLTDSYRAGFEVQQARGRWSEIDRQFRFEDIEMERFPLLIDAEERYES